MYKPCKTIAEIGCNHKGDINIAKELILSAKNCGADVAKFQKRNNKELLSEEQYNAPHPNPINSYGNTYAKSNLVYTAFYKEESTEDYSNLILEELFLARKKVKKTLCFWAKYNLETKKKQFL